MNIVVLDGYALNPGDNPWDPVAALGNLTVYDRTGQSDLRERGREADIFLTNKTPFSEEILRWFPRAKFISVLATGYNVVDIDAARRRGIPVSNVPEYGTRAVSQFVFALLLELCHRVGAHDAAVHGGEWSRCPDFSFWKYPLVGLNGLTMGIVGFGRIGRQVGTIAHAFGMDVLAHDVRRSDPPAYQPFSWAGLEEVFGRSDVVSLHCPETEESRRMVGEALLGRMKRGAFLINTSRGGLIDEPALAAALGAGRIAGAAVDVVSVEPIRSGNPLLTAPNCIITPHMAWATLEARQELMRQTAANIAAFLAGHPINVVNG
ncbi:MAG: D-2-hydroxyacid dehydrogenase [Planctomycetota bacterium]